MEASWGQVFLWLTERNEIFPVKVSYYIVSWWTMKVEKKKKKERLSETAYLKMSLASLHLMFKKVLNQSSEATLK